MFLVKYQTSLYTLGIFSGLNPIFNGGEDQNSYPLIVNIFPKF